MRHWEIVEAALGIAGKDLGLAANPPLEEGIIARINDAAYDFLSQEFPGMSASDVKSVLKSHSANTRGSQLYAAWVSHLHKYGLNSSAAAATGWKKLPELADVPYNGAVMGR